ncbi:MAG: ABC transporter ATP-binding protein [Firmicutes bacterium]|nr:ABC transporter ATP-binding protein [Bacillota bacterium]
MDKRGTVSKVIGRIKKYSLLILLSILFAIFSVAVTLYIPILVGTAIDCIVSDGRVDFAALAPILLKIAGFTLISAAIQWIMGIINNRVTFRVVQDIRNEAFEKIEILPLKYLDSHPAGEIVSKIIADADQFADGLLLGFTQLFTGIMTILGTLAFMFSINAGITVAVVVLTPLSLFTARFIAKHTYYMFKKQSEVRGEQTAYIEEMLDNTKIVQAFSREEHVQEKFNEINEILQKYSLKALFYSSITNPSTRFINSTVYACVALFGAFAAVSGRITVGGLSCFLSYANQYTKPFNEISGVITELQNALVCASRIFELIETPSETENRADAAVISDVDGRVELKNVCFSYMPERKLIENFNLSVKPGQKIAIVGPTGCGKTTLINLLMRFYDVDSGEISVDGTDIRKITRSSLRKNYGMVLQETWLENGSIRDNIAMGKPDATDAEIVEAAKASHAHGFIMRMPHGYDTVISDSDTNLSQGERQLLCIARVMLCRPPMLILDEATSSIDTRTEMKIQDAFSQLMKGKTSFIVAHRLSTVRDADIILVMRSGNIVEQGNHAELLGKKGFYFKLYNSQFAK